MPKRIQFKDVPDGREEDNYTDGQITVTRDVYYKLYCMAELAENMMSNVDDYLDEQLGLK